MKNTILALFAKIFQNPKKSEELVKEDRISALPDCLIVEILSRLPSTKYAIRTGTLSKRWEYLWTWVPTLSFKHTAAEFRQDPYSMSDFVSLVDKTLTQCCNLKLTKFVVELDINYRRRFESQVNSWIRYAISREVSELNLKFRFSVCLDQSFFICSCLTNLTLDGCMLYPTGVISWENLRSLCISKMRLDEGLTENMLSGSPLLETLELKSSGYRRLNITSQSLKKLVICGSAISGVVEINAPNLVSLTIRNALMAKILLQNVSSLVEAYLNFTQADLLWKVNGTAEEELLKGLILSLGHINELQIAGLHPEVQDHFEARGFVFPSNAKFVERFKWISID